MEHDCFKLMQCALKGFPSGSPKSKARFTVLAQILHLCDHPGFTTAYRKLLEVQ